MLLQEFCFSRETLAEEKNLHPSFECLSSSLTTFTLFKQKILKIKSNHAGA